MEVLIVFICSYVHADINECTINNGGCDQSCTNDIGGFRCGCDAGFVLEDDDRSCTGVYMLAGCYIVHCVT